MKQRLLTPGPTAVPEEVRLSLAVNMVHHRKEAFTTLLKEIQEGLRWLFGTKEPVLPLAASGTGAMVAAITNLFQPGDRVVVVEGGIFGRRFVKICASHGLDTVILKVPFGQAVTPAHIEKVLDPSVKAVLVQASETSTGVLHPIKEIAALTKKNNILLVVDGISTLGISPCPMDEWGIDCLLTGSQKGLMLPPGLSFVALSQKAWEQVEQTDPKTFYFNLRGERDRCLQNCQTMFTSPVNLLMGLATCLEIFQQRGFQDIFSTQWALAAQARAGIAAMGLELFAKDHFAWGLTSVKVPENIDANQVLHTCEKRYGVVLASGQGELKGKIIRFGHMGHVDFGDVLTGLYALHQSITRAGGKTADKNYLDEAVRAYEGALQHPPVA